MVRPALTQQVEEMAQPIARRMGLEVVDVEVLGEGPRTVLRVVVEGPQGVTVEECAQVSEVLSRQLDLRDLIPHAYTLEVSSPGLDRPLKRDADFDRFAGRLAEVWTAVPIDGQRHFKGRLMGLMDGQLRLAVGPPNRQQTVWLPYDRVAKARLVVDEETLRKDLGGGGMQQR